jgi:hypothetical protein
MLVIVRVALLVLLLLVLVGCGGKHVERSTTHAEPPRTQPQAAASPTSLDLAARDLVPPTATVSAPRQSDGCLGPFDRRTRCVMLHARGSGDPLATRTRAFHASARSRGWRLVRDESRPARSTSLVFRRGPLEAKVLLARSADLAVVLVSEWTRVPIDEERFVAAGRVVCKRFAVAVGRIPRSLPREEGLRRVRAAWQSLVNDTAQLTPPPTLRSRHREFLEALRAFGSALSPLQPRAASEAAMRVDRSAQAVGLPGCIPSAASE